MKLHHVMFFAALAVGLCLSTAASAQPGAERPDLSADNFELPEVPEGYPQNYVQRPITLPAMTIRGELVFTVFDQGIFGTNDVVAHMGLGAAFGILDNLEAGLSDERIGLRRNYYNTRGFIPVRLTGGDRRFGDMYLYGRYRFFHSDSFEIAGELGFQIPTRSDFGINAALPFRLRIGEIFSIDGGVEFSVVFADRGPGMDVEPIVSLPFTIQPRLAPVDFLYFGIDTGFVLENITNNSVLSIPFGVEAGYVLDIAPTRIDFFVNVAFPYMFASVDVGGTRMGDTNDAWAMTFGARGYIDVGR